VGCDPVDKKSFQPHLPKGVQCVCLWGVHYKEEEEDLVAEGRRVAVASHAPERHLRLLERLHDLAQLLRCQDHL